MEDSQWNGVITCNKKLRVKRGVSSERRVSYQEYMKRGLILILTLLFVFISAVGDAACWGRLFCCVKNNIKPDYLTWVRRYNTVYTSKCSAKYICSKTHPCSGLLLQAWYAMTGS